MQIYVFIVLPDRESWERNQMLKRLATTNIANYYHVAKPPLLALHC